MQSEQMHWLWTEVPMLEDVKDYQQKLTDSERDFLTKILRFFTQGDIDVSGAYVNSYLPRFKQPEVRMMLSSFAAREAVHIAAYSHLIETLGLPESIYNEFLQYEAMAAKHDFFNDLFILLSRGLSTRAILRRRLPLSLPLPKACSSSRALSCCLISRAAAR